MTGNAKTRRARALRNNPTEAEKKLWRYIRAGRLGVKFRRQYPIGPYITDFACKDKQLIIELDGGQHNEDQKEYDKQRTRFIEKQGFTVIRYWNNDVLQNINGIIEDLMTHLKSSPPPLNPPRTRGGGTKNLPHTRGGNADNPPPTHAEGKRQPLQTHTEGKHQSPYTHAEGNHQSPPPPAGGSGGEKTEKNTSLPQIKIIGGQELNGTIPISGAKNAALKLMCASLLTGQALHLENMPNGLRDIASQTALLSHIGVTIEARDNLMSLTASDVHTFTAPYDLVRKMRTSILVLGPLLARFGQARVSLPGGCAIGTRPVDLHIRGLEDMGAQITLKDGYINAEAPAGGLCGANILFPKVSVGATENLMMAATLAKGTTVLGNAAREPEIVDIGTCLIKMGAKITGLGTDTITIEGVPHLSGTRHSVVPDRIEAGTYIIAAGMAGGTVTLKNARIDHLSAALGFLSQAGMEVETAGDDIVVHRGGDRLKGVDIMTEPYPGFPTDLQAQFMAMLCISEGAGMVTETIFENRFMHVPELSRMGADITVQGNSAIVRGVPALTGAPVMATDLRASVALVLAGLVASGETVVSRIYHLERGYENIVKKLGDVGARIRIDHGDDT